MRLARRQAPPWDHWLLIRRSHSTPEDCAYYVVFAPAATPLAALARVAGRRWTIEAGFEAGKPEVGLGDYEIRSWQGWYRHITLALLALAFLAALRAKLNPRAGGAGQKGEPRSRLPVALSAPEIRRLIAKLQALTQAALRFILDWLLWRRCHQAIARDAIGNGAPRIADLITKRNCSTRRLWANTTTSYGRLMLTVLVV